jgi:hypothetical protein
MSRRTRWIAVILACAALAPVTTAAVAAILASNRGHSLKIPAGGIPLVALAVFAPVGGGLFVALRRPGNQDRSWP